MMPIASSMGSIAAGAMLGAWLRWFLAGQFNAAWPHLPLGTLIANVAGGFMIGFLVALLLDSPQIHPNFRLFAITGFLGGLTTFSTFSGEVVSLLLRREYAWAAGTAGVHLLGSLALTALGIALVAWLARGAA